MRGDNILKDLNETGIHVTHIDEFLSGNSFTHFNKAKSFFTDFLNTEHSKHYIDLVNTKSEGELKRILNKKKLYELTHFHLLNRGLGLDDYDLIQLYLSDEFIQLAKAYYQQDDIRIFNTFFMVSPKPLSVRRYASQNWHRDTEDVKNLKVFIYYNDVIEENGAFEYIPGSFARNEKELLANSKPKTDKDRLICSGKSGTMIIANTTGFHRGGLVKKGIRFLSHCLYIKPDAIQVKNGYFNSYNYNPSMNHIDFSSSTYNNLTDEQKRIIPK